MTTITPATSGKEAPRRNRVTETNLTTLIPAVNGCSLTKGHDLYQAAETYVTRETGGTGGVRGEGKC